MTARRLALICLAMLAQPAWAVELSLPASAVATASRVEAQTSIRLAIGPFKNGNLPTALSEGALEQTAYRLTLNTASTLALMQSLRTQLLTAGFEVIFECETVACGGFDFRYGLDVLPEPDMHVDLGDFRYLAVRRGPDDVIALMVSRSGLTGFVQVTQLGGALTVAPEDAPVVNIEAPAPAAPASASPAAKNLGVADDLVAGLERGLALPLEDLIFASGSSALVEGTYPSLVQLSDWLKADSRRVVTLVGHTDASGGLEGNIRLSKLRAESVRQHMLFAHKVAPEQVRAEGVGYLAPRASNLTEDGRHKNRRVEVMVTSTELLGP